MRVVGRFDLAAVAALLMLAAATPALAQSNDESFPQFEWNISTPGARANAMGRAFIGVADDASASISNPAGLVRLTRRQVYFEFKSTSLNVQRLADTRSLFTLQPTTFHTRVGAPSFISFSMPVNDKLSVAFTMHQFLNFKETFVLAPRPIPLTESVFFGVNGDTDFTGTSFSGSAAYILSKKLQVGGTLTFNKLSAQATGTRMLNSFGNRANQFDVTASGIVANQTSIDDSASAVGVVIGALYQVSEKLTAGVQFTKGPRFTISENIMSNPSTTGNPGLVAVDGFPKDVKINVPNRFGFGVSYRATSRLLAAFDVVRIGYSSLAKNMTIIFQESGVTPSMYSIANVTETHLGGEYVLFTGPKTLLVRAGVYTNPNHTLKFTGSDVSEIAKYNSMPRGTESVGTYGVGLVMGTKLQIDFAHVLRHEIVVSAAVRF